MADAFDLRSIPLTVYATLAEWVAHFQVSSLQNFFWQKIQRILRRAAIFGRSSERFQSGQREGVGSLLPLASHYWQ